MPLNKRSDQTYRLTASKARLLKMLLQEKAYRQMRPTTIYEPIPEQLRFHKSQAKERICVGANRGAKTTCCALEVAMACTGTHPYINYPKTGGRCVCVAQDETRIGEVMYRKLFMREAFWMKKDPETKKFRSWRPWVDGYELTGLTRCLPLIDKRMLDTNKGTNGIAWEKRSLNIPKVVYLRNGWEISFYSSKGAPPQGIDIDVCWFDEEVNSQLWYPEMAARLVDRNGRFIWSATPQVGTDELYKLHERAEEEALKHLPAIEEFKFLMDDNPFLSEEAKDSLKLKFADDPENYAIRVMGEYKVLSERVYPEFGRLHQCEPFDIPSNWCRYLIIDPAYNTTCMTFWAIPPKSERPHAYLYDELYCRQEPLNKQVERLLPKVTGQSFQAFLIDEHGSRRTETIGKTIGQQYREAFEAANIRSIATGHGFFSIGDDGHVGHSPKNIGIEDARSWLWKRGEFEDTPKLQVFKGICKDFCEEMLKYRRKTVKGRVTEKTEDKWSHGPDTFRYAVIHGLPYIEPRRTRQMLSGPAQVLAAKRKKERKKRGNNVILGPCG